MTTTTATMGTTSTQFSPAPALSRSAWHSPVPYLFGGLAAMLGLIAFALLILACSYWKLSNRLGDSERDLEAGEEKAKDDAVKPSPVYEEKFLVIMAGNINPTFIATPISCKVSSFGGDFQGKSEETDGEYSGTAEKAVQEMGHHNSAEEAQGNPESEEQSSH